MSWQIAIVGSAIAIGGIADRPALAQDGQTPGAPGRPGAQRGVIAAQDEFWTAFNACDLAGMEARLTEDVEFYHDKEGMNATRQKVAASMLTGRCDPPSDRQVRREAVAGTEELHLLTDGYALASGKHRFLNRTSDGIERHDSIARYTALWKDTASGWQMSRVLSYDHRADLPHLAPVPTTPEQLGALTGVYVLDDGTALPLSETDGRLVLGEGARAFALVHLGEGRFGVKDRWLQFRLSDGRIEIFDEGRLVASGAKEGEQPAKAAPAPNPPS